MTFPDLSRRSFLALAGGAVLLAACGGSDGESDGSERGSATTGGDGDTTTLPEFTSVAAGIVSSDLYAGPDPQRFAFAVVAKEGFASGAPARVAIAPPGGDPTEFVDATARGEGLPEFRGVYTIDATFDQPGTWLGTLEYGGEQSAFFFAVHEKPQTVVIGQPAVVSKSPTVADPLGVDPLCTQDPPCPLHDKSLDTLVGGGRPIALLFATPARCQTRYCGPVLDMLLPMQEEYPGVDFVHVEIYKDLTSEDVVPTVTDWHLPSEPWFFGIDAEGAVTARLDGAFDAAEIRSVLDGLTA